MNSKPEVINKIRESRSLSQTDSLGRKTARTHEKEATASDISYFPNDKPLFYYVNILITTPKTERKKGFI